MQPPLLDDDPRKLLGSLIGFGIARTNPSFQRENEASIKRLGVGLTGKGMRYKVGSHGEEDALVTSSDRDCQNIQRLVIASKSIELKGRSGQSRS